MGGQIPHLPQITPTIKALLSPTHQIYPIFFPGTRGEQNYPTSVPSSDDPSSKRQAVPSSDDPSKPSYSRPTYDGTIAGKVSGRTWKHVRTQRASATRVSRHTKTLELRNKEKEMKRAFKERVNELKEGIGSNMAEKRKKREEREKKKKENVLRSGTKK